MWMKSFIIVSTVGYDIARVNSMCSVNIVCVYKCNNIRYFLENGRINVVPQKKKSVFSHPSLS